MNSKERMLTAMQGGTPDRVPCSPDTNFLIPARLTGKPFWDVFHYGDPPLWKAYTDCVQHFGIDGFSHHGYPDIPSHPDTESDSEIVSRSDERMVIRRTFRCPAGTLTGERILFPDTAGTSTENYIKDLESQFDCLPYLMGDYKNVTFENYKKVGEYMGDNGVVGLNVSLPTLMFFLREPKEASMYDYYDHPDLVDEYMKMQEDKVMYIIEQIIEQNVEPDFVFFPNSGLLTLQSEEIVRKYAFPVLKKATRMLKEAGIVTSLHSCGKEYLTVEYAAAETDLDCIDPLEIPPMGDCSLKELKERFGDDIALKGNLHTTEVMLRMDPEGVEREARACLEDAMDGGGYILSTGDQCGSDTPDENIFKLLEVCETYGVY